MPLSMPLPTLAALTALAFAALLAILDAVFPLPTAVLLASRWAAFATTSSEAALPRAMESMERLGVPRQIVAS